MPNCGQDNPLVIPGLVGDCPPTNLCIPRTDGEPTEPPAEDEQPFAIDINTGCLWIYDCELETWGQGCGTNPVTLEGNPFGRGACFAIRPALNPNQKLFDSRYDEFFSEPTGLPVEWSFTNTTSEVGVIRIHATMWVMRYQPTALNPADAVMMFGLKSSVDGYDFDENALPIGS